MGLSSALATALAGLRTNQAALSIISSNVANAQTPGYVEQSPNQVEVASGTDGSTVQMTGVNRQLDTFIQNQLRTETSGSGYANQMANILGQLQSVYSRRRGHAGNDAEQFHHRAAVALDQSRQPVVAERGAVGGAVSCRAAELDDARHPAAAHQCRSGHR